MTPTEREEIKTEVDERFPEFNRKERHKIESLVRRRRYLEEAKNQEFFHEHARDRMLAEIAALEWVLDELEAMEKI